VHVDGNFGKSKGGQAVFAHSFSRSSHVAKNELLVNQEVTLLVGMDFGRTPCAVIGQLDGWGRYLIFDEVISEDMGLTGFLREKLVPVLGSPRFYKMRFLVIGDPAGAQKSQTDEQSPFDVLRKEKFDVVSAPTNDVDARIRAMEQELLKTLNIGPAFLIDPRCTRLIRAFSGEYRYPKTRLGTIRDRPEKKHPVSDLIDGVTYLVMGAVTRRTGRALYPRQRSWERGDQVLPVAAWT
jgi:hypothetical protein